MKLLEVPFREGVVESMKKYPIIGEQIENLETDFGIIYGTHDYLNNTVEELTSLKSDLFVAFCHGAYTATCPESVFNRSFFINQKPDESEEFANSLKL